MDDQETEFEPPIEHIIIALACAVQLRRSNLEFEELLFLQKIIEKEIKKYERDIH